MDLSEEQILHLAPDESSKKSGKDLANPAKWVSKAISTRALWGECQGSGSKPYQTQVDLANLAFKCSCPSRKFPCKHGLGLLLLSAGQPALFQPSEEPGWVSDWINKRTEKEEKKAEKKESPKPVDEAAQAKRQQARQSKVTDGIEELLLWIKDQVRTGIHAIPSKAPAWWENMARRMVDAQAPGLAGMVRSLANTNFFRDGWQSEYIDQLLRIYLVITGHQHLDHLPPALKEDINSHIGFTVSQEELKASSGTLDTWLVLAKQSSEEQGITTERYWLFGTSTGQYALILQFLVRGQGAQLSLSAGMFIRAELVFFPSAAPLRALIKTQTQSGTAGDVQGFANWDTLSAADAATTALLPFAGERPFVIQRLTPVRHDQHWCLMDDRQTIMPIKRSFRNIWKILALSGGQPLNMAVLGRERSFEPIGIWHNHQYKII